MESQTYTRKELKEIRKEIDFIVDHLMKVRNLLSLRCV